MTRTITRKVTTVPPHPGFIGAGHTQVHVVEPTDLERSDPFVLLEDDRLVIPKRRQIGGAHPHAGLETVTFVLEGTIDDRDEGHLSAGDLLWMTAGRGIIHSESIQAEGTSRILQLWIALPERLRGTAPDFELVRKDAVPVVRERGVEARLYSGSAGPLRSTTRNVVPVTLLDLKLQTAARFTQALPTTYNGFVYVIDGSIEIAGTKLATGEVGWFAPSDATDISILGGDEGARVVLYAGEPLREPIMQHGPFVAGTPDQIRDYYRDFRAGKFASMDAIARARAQGQQVVTA
jgi:redox-sensitive bicupin YhaK (pirin superfamily)